MEKICEYFILEYLYLQEHSVVSVRDFSLHEHLGILIKWIWGLQAVIGQQPFMMKERHTSIFWISHYHENFGGLGHIRWEHGNRQV